MDYLSFVQLIENKRCNCPICSHLLIQRRCNLATHRNTKDSQNTIIFFYHDLFYCTECKCYYIRSKSLNKFQNRIGRKVYTKNHSIINGNKHHNCDCIMTAPIIRTQIEECKYCEFKLSLESKLANIGLHKQASDAPLIIGNVKIYLPYCIACGKYQVSKNDVFIPHNLFDYYKPTNGNKRITNRYELILLIKQRLGIYVLVPKPDNDLINDERDNVMARITLLNLDSETENTYFAINEDGFCEDEIDEIFSYIVWGNLVSNNSLLYNSFVDAIKNGKSKFGIYEIVGYKFFKNDFNPLTLISGERFGSDYITTVNAISIERDKTKRFFIVKNVLKEDEHHNIYHINHAISKAFIDAYCSGEDYFFLYDHMYDIKSFDETEALQKLKKKPFDLTKSEVVQVYLHNNYLSCKRFGHELEYVTAIVQCSETSKFVHMNITHCKTCPKYCISEESFLGYIRDNGAINVTVEYDEGYTRTKSWDKHTNGWRLASELKLLGYTAGAKAPSHNRRIGILLMCMELGRMSRREIIDHLEWCEKMHSHHPIAVEDYQEDSSFLRNIYLHEQDEVFGEIIKRVKTRNDGLI